MEARLFVFDVDSQRREARQLQLDQLEPAERVAHIRPRVEAPPCRLTAAQVRAAGDRLVLFAMTADVTRCWFDPEYGRLWAEREQAWGALVAELGDEPLFHRRARRHAVTTL